MLNMADELSKLSTCPRLHTACIFTDPWYHIVSAGFNGAPPGIDHCDKVGCIIEENHCVKSLHGEKNAILIAGHKSNNGRAFITHFPCIRCSNDMVAVGIKKIYYRRHYGNEANVKMVTRLLKEANVELYRTEGLL